MLWVNSIANTQARFALAMINLLPAALSCLHESEGALRRVLRLGSAGYLYIYIYIYIIYIYIYIYIIFYIYIERQWFVVCRDYLITSMLQIPNHLPFVRRILGRPTRAKDMEGCTSH